MNRRDFLRNSSAVAVTAASLSPLTSIAQSQHIDIAWYNRSRRFADLSFGRIAYVEHGSGPAALFVHGYPVNSYQWRGALQRLHTVRRCIAPDLMALGYSQPKESQIISPHAQADMLAALLEYLKVDAVDLVANDSGGITAQLFVAKYPQRVRTLLLTNCDVDTNNPPPQFTPFVEQAKHETLVENFVLPHLKDKVLAHSQQGMGQAFSYPAKLANETIDYYLTPIASSALRQRQFNQFTIALGENVLVPVREQLHAWKGHARFVWGMKDTLFPVQWAEWLNKTFPGARGIRRIPDGNLFFPEEFPDVIAEEARRLWELASKTPA